MIRRAFAALAATIVAASPVRAASATGAPAVTVYDDGLELLVYPVQGARRAALWIVARAGGVNDPRGKGGIAHLMEHLALRGSHDVDGRAFMDEARAAGAIVNAHTFPERMTFELDAPADRIDALGARFLALVTSPAWQDANLERERGIIETEAAYHSAEGLLSLVDLAVFPSPQQGGPLAGTSESRADLRASDAIAFFERSLVPRNLTVILTGAVRPAQGRELVERAFRIPPPPEGEGSTLPRERPQLPVTQKMFAGVFVEMLGYLLDPLDRELCAPVAALLELRLALAIQGSNQRVSSVSVDCQRLRGNDFLIAHAFTTTLGASELPQTMAGVFSELGTNPPAVSERLLIDGRLARQAQRLHSDPSELAERLSLFAAERQGPRTELGRLRPPGVPTAARLAEFVRRSLAEDRKVLLSISPMQN